MNNENSGKDGEHDIAVEHDIAHEIVGETEVEAEKDERLPLGKYLRLQLKQGFDGSFVFFCVLSVIAGVLVYYTKGETTFRHSVDSALDMVISIAPRLTAALLIAGFIRALVSKDAVAKWMGKRSRLRGIIIGELAGMLTPGGPVTAFSMIAALKTTGADRGVLVAYAISWALLGFQRILLWDLPLLGSDFSITRILSSLAMPLACGLLARFIPIDFERYEGKKAGR